MKTSDALTVVQSPSWAAWQKQSDETVAQLGAAGVSPLAILAMMIGALTKRRLTAAVTAPKAARRA